MNTYAQAIEYLNSSLPAFHHVGAEAFNAGLSNARALMSALDNPQEKFLSVHVAGTNGKGSTSHLMAAALQQAGLKVGLYTSPHLVDFAERIRINGKTIDETYVVDFLNDNRKMIEDINPSFFELTMAMAFAYFADSKVDIAVVEVGLGGRLDSTNIITPLVSVITNIGLDHTELLGSTLAEIAAEKAGIIKQEVPVVIGQSDEQTTGVFTARARELSAPILFADHQPEVVLECQLKGDYQKHNINTTYYALKTLSEVERFKQLLLALHLKPFDRPLVEEAFKHVVDLTGLRGRWEILCQQPLMICDTGHNSHGLRPVFGQLERLYEQRVKEFGKGACRLRILMGMMSDKDVDVVVDLLPRDAVYYITQTDSPRAMKADELLQRVKNRGMKGRGFENLSEALSQVLTDSCTNDIIFIGGSNYIVGKALHFLSAMQ